MKSKTSFDVSLPNNSNKILTGNYALKMKFNPDKENF